MEIERMVEPDSWHLRRYEFAASFAPGRSVLDAACGAGYGSHMLMAAGAKSVLGVDISAEAIEHASSVYGMPGIQFRVADCFEVEGSFDLVVSFETIEHLRDAALWPQRIADLLAPGGLAIISTPYRQQGTVDDVPRNPFHVVEWNSNEFLNLLVPAFSSVLLYFQGISIPFIRGNMLTRPMKRGLMIRDLVLQQDSQPLAVDEWLCCGEIRPTYMVAVCHC